MTSNINIFKVISNAINFLLGCIIRGVLIIVPFILTWYVISTVMGIFNKVIGMGMPMSGIAIIVFVIILVGYFAKSFVVRLLYDLVELVILRVPGIGVLYSSVKDFTFAFIDKKVKFDKPVLICINVAVGQKEDIKKIGFITNENLHNLGLEDHVSVFVPGGFSFSLSGEFLLVPRKNLIPLDEVDGTQMMTFVVSAGFVDNNRKKKDN